MKFFIILMLSSFFFACFSTLHADDQINLEALGGWGFPRAYHAELGTRAGYFFQNNIYTGVDYSHFFSGSHHLTSSNLVSAEGGYRFATPWTAEVIPYLGLGTAVLNELNSSYAKLLVNPGVKIDYPVGPLYVGIDNQYQIVPHHNALALAGTVGIRL